MNKTETQEFIGACKVGLRQKDTTLTRLRYLIPQRLEGGKLINFDGNVIGEWDGEDCELGSQERVDKATKCTEALLTEVFKPIQVLFGSAGEMAEQKKLDTDDGEDENYVELKTPEEVEAEKDEPEVDQKEPSEPALKALKKELKGMEKGTKEYKKLKKRIKALKGE